MDVKEVIVKKARLRREIRDIVSAHVSSDAGLDEGNMDNLIDDIVGTFSQEEEYRNQEAIDSVRAECDRKIAMFKAHEEALRNEMKDQKDKIAELKDSINNDSAKNILVTKLASEQHRARVLKQLLKTFVEEL
jgi:hypothetical protein